MKLWHAENTHAGQKYRAVKNNSQFWFKNPLLKNDQEHTRNIT